MLVRLYDTLSRRKKSLEDRVVKAYFCGPTVYDVPHLGHARAYVVFDVLLRLLRYLGYKVIYVRNVTDIDDKIINRAEQEGVSPFEIADRYYREFYDAMKNLGVIDPNVEPRATGHIPEIISFIEGLLKKGFAYVTPDGVYFRVRKFGEYGKLSKRDIDSLIRGARVEHSPYKEDPLDFALWKAAKPNEPYWESPWGRGRPGWHIECSAMILKHLGETIDIHGGGEDLIFPHHENEIAQTEALTGKEFVKIWFHVGLLIVGKDKMAKSLGNFVSIKEALKKHSADAIRLFLISAHYRKQLVFSWEQLENAEKTVNLMYRALYTAEYLLSTGNVRGRSGNMSEVLTDYKNKFLSVLVDDLNTPEAIAVLINMARWALNNMGSWDDGALREFIRVFKELGGLLGVLEMGLEDRIALYLKMGRGKMDFMPANYIPKSMRAIEKLIRLILDVRLELRRQKLYSLADEIRESLQELGIAIEDTRDGYRFRFVDPSLLLGD